MTKVSLKNRGTHIQKFAKALYGTKGVTAAAARTKYRVPNPSATVFSLRKAGMDIQMNAGKYFAA